MARFPVDQLALERDRAAELGLRAYGRVGQEPRRGFAKPRLRIGIDRRGQRHARAVDTLAGRGLDPRRVDLQRAGPTGIDHRDEQDLLRARRFRDLGRTARLGRAIRREIRTQRASNVEAADRIDDQLGAEPLREIRGQRIDALGIEVDGGDGHHDDAWAFRRISMGHARKHRERTETATRPHLQHQA